MYIKFNETYTDIIYCNGQTSPLRPNTFHNSKSTKTQLCNAPQSYMYFKYSATTASLNFLHIIIYFLPLSSQQVTESEN